AARFVEGDGEHSTHKQVRRQQLPIASTVAGGEESTICPEEQVTSIEGVHGNRQSAAHYFAGARLKPADATISGSEQPSPRTCVGGTCPAWPSAYGNREEDTNNSDTRARHASECAGERWEAAPTSPPAPGRSGRNGVRRDHRHRVLTGRGVD